MGATTAEMRYKSTSSDMSCSDQEDELSVTQVSIATEAAFPVEPKDQVKNPVKLVDINEFIANKDNYAEPGLEQSGNLQYKDNSFRLWTIQCDQIESGWRKRVSQRAGQQTFGKMVVTYYGAKKRQRLRSLVELAEYNRTTGSKLEFDFSSVQLMVTTTARILSVETLDEKRSTNCRCSSSPNDKNEPLVPNPISSQTSDATTRNLGQNKRKTSSTTSVTKEHCSSTPTKENVPCNPKPVIYQNKSDTGQTQFFPTRERETTSLTFGYKESQIQDQLQADQQATKLLLNPGTGRLLPVFHPGTYRPTMTLPQGVKPAYTFPNFGFATNIPNANFGHVTNTFNAIQHSNLYGYPIFVPTQTYGFATQPQPDFNHWNASYGAQYSQFPSNNAIHFQHSTPVYNQYPQTVQQNIFGYAPSSSFMIPQHQVIPQVNNTLQHGVTSLPRFIPQNSNCQPYQTVMSNKRRWTELEGNLAKKPKIETAPDIFNQSQLLNNQLWPAPQHYSWRATAGQEQLRKPEQVPTIIQETECEKEEQKLLQEIESEIQKMIQNKQLGK